MTRVLAHAHSTWSHDGHIALSAWPSILRQLGCRIVLLSEHEESGWDDRRYAAYSRACAELSTPDARLVPGIEFLQDGHHVLCYGLRRLPPRPSTASELAAHAHEQGCVLTLAHPGKYHWRIAPELLAHVDAIEVWNSKWIYDGAAGPHPASRGLVDGRLALVGQDVHKPKHLSSLVLVTEGDGTVDGGTDGGDADVDSVLADLASGRFGVAWGEREWSSGAWCAEIADAIPSRLSNARARTHRIWMDAALRGYRLARRPLRAASSASSVAKASSAASASASTSASGSACACACAPASASASRASARALWPAGHGINAASVATPMPMVSVILPIRNEESYIARALDSVLAQDYPADRLEILVADGRSTDRTRDIVRQASAHAAASNSATSPMPPIMLIDNPGEIVPAGLNVALAVATGDVIVRVDGHCDIPPDFVRRAVSHLVQDDVDCVGGVLDTIGQTRMARVIAVAMSARFGVGGSAFRSGARIATLTDTVAFPAFTRRAIERAGWFDEELVRNQDDEYNYRLRRIGGRILLATDMPARYYSRGTLRSLWRQCLQYGYWKVRVLQKHPRQMRARQFVPALFVLALIASAGVIALRPALWPIAALIIGAYAAAACVAVLSAARTATRDSSDPLFLAAVLPLAFLTMHLAYGAGFLGGLVAFWRRWRTFGQLGDVPPARSRRLV